MFEWLSDKVGAVLSAPVDFIRGMGGGWKFGVAAGIAAIGASLLGVEGITPERVMGIALGGTLVGGVAGGATNMVKEFLKSPEGKEAIQDGLEQVVETVAPGLENQLGNLPSQQAGDQQVINAQRTAG